jgi:hypothetical protein
MAANLKPLLRPAAGLAVGAVLAVAGITAWQKMATDAETKKEAAMIAEWERRPIVYICERHPGEQIVFDRKEPTGPDAQPEAEPRQFIFKGSICDGILSARGDGHDGK